MLDPGCWKPEADRIYNDDNIKDLSAVGAWRAKPGMGGTGKENMQPYEVEV